MSHRDPTVENATQLEVAIRQLNTSINLFFHSGDVFSIYSLTRNAEEIISGCLRVKGCMSLWDDIVNNHVKSEYKEKLLKMANDPRNNLKHKRNGENDKVSLPIELNEHFLHTCVNALQIYWPSVWGQHPECGVFMAWMRTHHPELYITKVETIKGDELLSKPDFFKKYKYLYQEVERQHGPL